MKQRIVLYVSALCVGAAMCGCAANEKLIAEVSRTQRNDIFTEVRDATPPPGMATVEFNLSLKSNSSYFMGSYVKHTNPPYRVNLSIDGQETIVEAEPVLEERLPIDPTVPESGTGWKYRFVKRIALAPGKHHLSVVLPLDNVRVEREIDVRPGSNAVTVTPVYKRKMLRPYRGENFSAGVKRMEVTVR